MGAEDQPSFSAETLAKFRKRRHVDDFRRRGCGVGGVETNNDGLRTASVDELEKTHLFAQQHALDNPRVLQQFYRAVNGGLADSKALLLHIINDSIGLEHAAVPIDAVYDARTAPAAFHIKPHDRVQHLRTLGRVLKPLGPELLAKHRAQRLDDVKVIRGFMRNGRVGLERHAICYAGDRKTPSLPAPSRPGTLRFLFSHLSSRSSHLAHHSYRMPNTADFNQSKTIHAPFARRAVVVAAIAIPLVGTIWLAAFGQDEPFSVILATILERILRSGGVAAAYLLAAIGLGRLFTPIVRRADDRPLVQVFLGFSLLLFASHAMGWAGLLTPGVRGTIIAWVPIALGLGLLMHQLATSLHGSGVELRVRVTTLPACVGIAVLLAAACNPPGWLWDSEFGGFDALSYHLALPQEWFAQGRLTPVTHNVYSYLPGSLEAAFLHLACLLHAPPMVPAGATLFGLTANDGRGVFACQFLAVGTAILAAWAIARAVEAFVRRLGDHAVDSAHASGSLAFALALTTPWLLVVGSLAYNDAAMVALSAAGLAVAADRSLPPTRKGLIVGALIGAACCCKPTAIFLVAPAAGLAMTLMPPNRDRPGTRPLRSAALALLGATIAGIILLSPWMLRNYLACGNPVFPFAWHTFGLSHWSAEQHTRFDAAHHFTGSFFDRIRLMALPDPSDPAGARHRGVLHAQWGWLFPAGLLAGVWALVRQRAAIPVLVLATTLVLQLAAWLTFTHIQSRFLLPLLPTLIALITIATIRQANAGRDTTSSPNSGRARSSLALLFPAILSLGHAALAVAIFTQQREKHPNQFLTAGTGIFTGELMRSDILRLAPAERSRLLASLPPAAFINLALRPETRVLLVGDVLPLHFNVPPIYCTTWDRSPLADAMKAFPSPESPDRWTQHLRSLGARAVLVNLSEIRRYARSGTLDPDLREDSITAWLKTLPVLCAWPEQGLILAALESTTPTPPHTLK
jgi:hypothetical protein